MLPSPRAGEGGGRAERAKRVEGRARHLFARHFHRLTAAQSRRRSTVPPSRAQGGESTAHSFPSAIAPEFCSVIASGTRSNPSRRAAELDGFVSPAITKEGSGTPTSACVMKPCCEHGGASGGMRSPVGVPPRLSPGGFRPFRSAPGQASWDVVARRIGWTGVTRPYLSQSRECTSRTGRSTGEHDARSCPGADCKSARRHRTRSVFRFASGSRPLRERDS